MKRILLALLILAIAVPALALRSYTDFAQSDTGARLYQAEIYVYLAGTSTPASLYSDDGVTAKAQPLVTDSHGKYRFYVADGAYDIKQVYGGDEVWRYDVQIVDLLGAGSPQYRVNDAEFGAIAGDGIDDTAAIQAACDAIEASGVGGTLILPPGGNFDVEDYITLPSNIAITGGGTIKRSATSTSAIFYSVGETGISIKDITIDGNSGLTEYTGSGLESAIRFFSCSDVKIEGCTIYDPEGDCVYISRAAGDPVRGENIQIKDNILLRSRRDAITVIDGVNISIEGNTILDTYGQAIDIEPNSDPTYSFGVDGLSIEGNVVRCTLPMTAQGAYSWMPTALGVDFKAGTGGDLDTHGYGITITGNTFVYEEPDPTANDDGTRRPALAVVSCAGVYPADVSFQGNTIRSNVVSGYAAYGLLNFRSNLLLLASDNIITGTDSVQTTHATEDGDWGVYAAIDVVGLSAGTPMAQPILTGNRVQGNFRQGITAFYCEAPLYSDNSIKHTGGTTNTFGMYLNTCTAAQLSNNTIIGPPRYGVRVTSSSVLTFLGGEINASTAALYATGTVDSVICGFVTTNLTDSAGFGSNAMTRTGTINGFHEVYTIHAPSLP